MIQLESGFAAKAELFTTWTNGCVQNNGVSPASCFSDWNAPKPWDNPLRTTPFSSAPGWRLGAGKGGTDSISIPIATIIDGTAGSKAAFSLALDPTDPLGEVALRRDEYSVGFERSFLRVAPAPSAPSTSTSSSSSRSSEPAGGNVLSFSAHIVAHPPSWRSGLHFYTQEWNSYFVPKVGDAHAAEYEGLGSYSWYQGQYNASRSNALGFKTNWDLSGTWMPYDGLFLPYQDKWLNLGPINGGLAQYNVTYAMIDKYYADIQARGFHSLSYFDVGNWGTQTKLPAQNRTPTTCGTIPNLGGRGAPCPTPAGGNQYLQDVLQPALIVHGWEAFRGSWTGYREDWVGTTDMDMGEPVFQDLIAEQATRHLEKLDHFEGIAIDRLDYSEFFNFDRDDGISWIPSTAATAGPGPHRPAQSLRHSHRAMFSRLSEIMHNRTEKKMIWMNCNSLCRIDLLGSFDGTFSEGAALNAVAWTGLFSPTIMWTYALGGQTAEQLDTFFQQHLAMNVYPMAPMPANDHSIPPSGDASLVETQYRAYAPLFDAMHGARWVLDVPEPILVTAAGAGGAGAGGAAGGKQVQQEQERVRSQPPLLGATATFVPCNSAAALQNPWVHEGDKSLRIKSSAGACLDVWQCGKSDGTTVDIFPCHPNGTRECGYTNQQWTLDTTLNRIKNVNWGNGCLTAGSEGPFLSECLQGDAQQVFELTAKGLIVAGRSKNTKSSSSTGTGIDGISQQPVEATAAEQCLVLGTPPPSPPAPPPPPPMPPWKGIAVANVWRLPNNSAVLGAVMLADAAATSKAKVIVQLGVLPAGVATKGRLWVLHPNATMGGWVPLGTVTVAAGTNITSPAEVPLVRGCAFVKLTPW